LIRALLALALLGSHGCGGGSAPARSVPRRPLAPELREVGRLAGEQRFEAAEELARRFVAAHPKDGQGLYFLGMTHYWTGNFGAARPWIEQALALEPDIAIAHESLGYCLFMLGDLGGARREYEAFLVSLPDEPKGHYGLGLIELDETHLDSAAARFRRAIELHEALRASAPAQAAARVPELAECHARLGEVHFARGDYEAARAELVEATTLCPSNISAFYTLGLVYRRLGDEARADQAAERFESARRALVAGQGAR
jgi:Flp pilus assembly protein TadD